MDKRNFKGKHKSEAEWFAKLSEEVGEVAKEILARVRARENQPYNPFGIEIETKKKRRKELIKELDHVEFIARCFREDLELDWKRND